LALAKILLQGANCLLLDEPTNHLDINSKRVLQKAIQDFQGSVIIVSHDRAFLDPIVSRIWEIREKKVQVFYGNVSAYVQSVEDKERAAAQAAKSQKTTAKVVFDPLPVLPPHAHAKAYRKAQIDSSARIKKMEEAVQALEARRDAMEKDLADPSVFKHEPAKAHQLARDHTALVKELENQWEAWSRAQEEHALSFKE
jgi:ATP-binding cassette subfamily F protein 3